MFYFRLNKVVIFDNGAIKPFLGIFGHDFADVKFLSFVTPSNLNLPAMDEFLRTTDPITAPPCSRTPYARSSRRANSPRFPA